ncbi:DNA gyrase subunit A [Desulfobulbus oligotrophicus]|jgi:DNA gyrase subunit A|uniref:DNA gyrase subunit A n=1 Tax=Desulfobulbus oligotrophicus TaxID=1909699 RepID=A0A7T6AQ09_9BACT|nr:DNA gyrase subunit A [Desulfobulbus oligotrophicus]MDY0390269.1 DNA gyrase subunit A [Desulfobulbus oligotrophicus]QQG65092.1 DNA gyrase subunit A [Desulfobulbus oligotrophicus]
MTEQLSEQKEYPTIPITKELQKSYLDYAMSVIIGRALPDVRDGLKPVHRRTLFAMRELGNTYNRPYIKSARIVGDVIGKFHPHGDTAAYDTLVRLAQDFSMRYPLVDGQGNFGSMDGDPAAAMRYTEARMTKLDQELVADLDKETVDFLPNYDNSLQEPAVLPSKIPNILINGSEGIAVGMATKIPPHNLTEVITGLLALINNPDITVHQLMEVITGPDFPTGGFLCGRAGIREAYETGRGVVVIRSKTHIEQRGTHGESIIITEIPFQQNKATMVEKIAQLVKDKRITSIVDIRDESDRHGVRVVLDLRKDEIPEVVINQLHKMTPMQRSFGIILLCIVNNKPEILNLKQILQHFLIHRKTVVYRRTAFELRKAEERAHILEGLKVAISHLDEVVELIKRSADPGSAKEGLVARFELSEVQAQTILDMRLQRLTGLERDKIIADYNEIIEKIAWLTQVLNDDSLVVQVIREELERILEEYGDARRTEIIDAPDEILPEDLITPEEMVVTVSHSGYIKRNPINLYRAQRRGGKGIKGMVTLEDDFVVNLYTASSLDTFLFFTNRGRVFWRKVYELPLAGRTARGRAIINLLELGEKEKVAAILPVADLANMDDSVSVLTVTKQGRVKKTSIAEYKRPLRKGKFGLTIRDDDEILTAAITSGEDEIFLATKKGLSIRFHEKDVRVMGRLAAGVKGISLGEEDEVVGVAVLQDAGSILTVAENGYGKRTDVAEYPLQNRGGKGVFTIKTSERNGDVVGVLPVVDDDQVMLIASSGQIIRMPMDTVRIIGRNTQGVRLINLEESEYVVDLSMLAREEAVDDEEVVTGEEYDDE